MTALGRNIDHKGFACSIDAASARRQLHLSVGVVVVLAIAIVTAAFSLNIRPVSAPSYVVSVPSMTQQAQQAVTSTRS